MNFKKKILLILLVILIVQNLYAELLTKEDLNLLIPLEKLYTGIEVQALLWDIFQALDEEITQICEKKVTDAVIPLFGEIEYLKEHNRWYSNEILIMDREIANLKKSHFFTGVTWFSIGIAIGGIGCIIMFAAIGE